MANRGPLVAKIFDPLYRWEDVALDEPHSPVGLADSEWSCEAASYVRIRERSLDGRYTPRFKGCWSFDIPRGTLRGRAVASQKQWCPSHQHEHQDRLHQVWKGWSKNRTQNIGRARPPHNSDNTQRSPALNGIHSWRQRTEPAHNWCIPRCPLRCSYRPTAHWGSTKRAMAHPRVPRRPALAQCRCWQVRAA
jgi:hypothetical protein